MPIDYRVLIDYADNGEDAADITADVVALNWRLGMERPFDTVSRPTRATVTVRNWGGAYSPERGDLQSSLALTILSDDGTHQRLHFSGFVRRITPSAGDYGVRMADIIAEGAEAQLLNNTVSIAPLQKTSADAVIHAVLDACRLRLYPSASYCLIDIAGRNVINEFNIYGEQNIARSLDEGKSTFAYIGDTWQGGIPAWQAIAEATSSERGRFFINRAGEAVFYNRHTIMLNNTVAATFSDDMHGLRYVYGSGLVNEITVTVQPRTIGLPDSIVWRLGQPQRIRANSVQSIRATYQDDAGQAIGALDVAYPLPGIHYSASQNADGSGADRTAALELSVTFSAGGAALQVRNSTHQDVYLQMLTLRGTPLTTQDPVTLVIVDKVRIALDGLRPLDLNLPAITTLEEAERIGLYELFRRKNPAGRVQMLEVGTATHPQQALGLTLFERIRITEAQTGHTADYRIIAEDHAVDRAGTRHRVRWTLEPADDDIYFVINRASLDGERLIVPF